MVCDGCKVGPSDKPSSQCPQALTQQVLPPNSADLAKAMGMNQTCKQATSASAANGELHGSANLLFFNANIGASFTSSASSESSSGCGSRSASIISQSNNVQNLQCTLNSASATASVNATIGTNVKIIVRSMTKAQSKIYDQQIAAMNSVLKGLTMALSAPGISDKTYQILSKTLNNTTEQLGKISQPGIIDKVNITNTSKVTAVAVSRTTVVSAQKVVAQTLTDIKTKAQSEVAQKLGVASLGTNVNNFVEQRVSENLDNITTQINDAVAQSNVAQNFTSINNITL